MIMNMSNIIIKIQNILFLANQNIILYFEIYNILINYNLKSIIFYFGLIEYKERMKTI
jgi:hypothetical protein